jgi:hypothetical protein
MIEQLEPQAILDLFAAHTQLRRVLRLRAAEKRPAAGVHPGNFPEPRFWRLRGQWHGGDRSELCTSKPTIRTEPERGTYR